MTYCWRRRQLLPSPSRWPHSACPIRESARIPISVWLRTLTDSVADAQRYFAARGILVRLLAAAGIRQYCELEMVPRHLGSTYRAAFRNPTGKATLIAPSWSYELSDAQSYRGLCGHRKLRDPRAGGTRWLHRLAESAAFRQQFLFLFASWIAETWQVADSARREQSSHHATLLRQYAGSRNYVQDSARGGLHSRFHESPGWIFGLGAPR